MICVNHQFQLIIYNDGYLQVTFLDLYNILLDNIVSELVKKAPLVNEFVTSLCLKAAKRNTTELTSVNTRKYFPVCISDYVGQIRHVVDNKIFTIIIKMTVDSPP